MYSAQIFIETILISVTICPWVIGTSSKRRTGFYVINDDEQTISEKWLSPEEESHVKSNLLRLLGLPERTIDYQKAPIVEMSARNFMLDLYAKVTNQKKNSTSEFRLSKRDLSTIVQSDVIISFMATQPHKGLGGKPDRVKRMWFDISDVADGNDIMTNAELRLYRGPYVNKEKNRGAFVISVYRILRTEDGERDWYFVDSVRSDEKNLGWITLNVTESVNHWRMNPDENYGLYVSAFSDDGILRKVKPENIGIVGFDGVPEQQPFIAGYYKNLENRLLQFQVNDFVARYKRSNILRAESEDQDDRWVDPENHSSKTACKFHTLFVNFEDLKNYNSIIAPLGYEANFCQGECAFPLSSGINATNHAIVQSFVHLKNLNDKVPMPCCTPTKLSPTSIVYYHDDNSVVMKNIEEMVVDRCGCH